LAFRFGGGVRGRGVDGYKGRAGGGEEGGWQGEGERGVEGLGGALEEGSDVLERAEALDRLGCLRFFCLILFCATVSWLLRRWGCVLRCLLRGLVFGAETIGDESSDGNSELPVRGSHGFDEPHGLTAQELDFIGKA